MPSAHMKVEFVQEFRRRFSLRLHMLVILLSTVCSGVLASKALLAVGLRSLVLRYPLAVLLAYFVFFACVKLWLICVTSKKREKALRVGERSSLADISALGSGGRSGGGNMPTFRPGGGQFGGGGASSSLDFGTAVALDPHAGVGGAAVGGGGPGDAVGSVLEVVGDDEHGFATIVAAIVLSVLLATILGSTAYVVYQAPTILSEAAFQALLVASLVKRTRKIASGDWIGSVFLATWKPFLITLLIAFLAGQILAFYFPAASRITEILIIERTR